MSDNRVSRASSALDAPVEAVRVLAIGVGGWELAVTRSAGTGARTTTRARRAHTSAWCSARSLSRSDVVAVPPATGVAWGRRAAGQSTHRTDTARESPTMGP